MMLHKLPLRVYNELLCRAQSIIHVIGKKAGIFIQYNRVYIKNDYFLNTSQSINRSITYSSTMLQKVIGIANIWVVHSKFFSWGARAYTTSEIKFTASSPKLYDDFFRY
jgi:hypothetical protein